MTTLEKPPRFLTFQELKGRGILYCRQHLPRMEKAGQFPTRRRIGPNRVGWLEAEIDQWLRSRPSI